MIDQLTLLWSFLQAQPAGQWLQLAEWHLLLVLAVLSVLGAFGLHFLIGYVFGFYRRKGKHARWLAWPTLLVLLVSLPLLLGAYLLAVRAPQLVHGNLTTRVTAELGRMLLEPAFQAPALQGVHPDEVPKAAIKAALRESAELSYRQRLETFLVDPQALAAAAGPDAHASGPQVMVQMGLRWVTSPHNTWFAPVRRGDQADTGDTDEQPFFLPDFLLSLIDELPEGTALPRLDWEHVAGTRFVEGVLRPLTMEYMAYVALGLTLAVLLADGLYFLLMARLKRIGQPRPPKPAKPGKALPAAKAPPPARPPDATASVPAAQPPPPAPPAAGSTPATPAAPSEAPQSAPPGNGDAAQPAGDAKPDAPKETKPAN